MPTVYKTGHQIADTVAEAFRPLGYEFRDVKNGFYHSDCHIAYGILRGTADIWFRARNLKEKFIFLDRGFLRPNHFDGYYRFGINNFQQPYEAHAFSSERLEKIMGSEPLFLRDIQRGDHILVCPPTENTAYFYNMGSQRIWLEKILYEIVSRTDRPIRVRYKDSNVPIEHDLKNVYCVVTHISGAAWHAMRYGIPAIGMSNGIIQTWNGLTLDDLDTDKISLDKNNAMKLFSYMAHHQFTLDEISNGEALHLIEGYKDIIHREHLIAC